MGIKGLMKFLQEHAPRSVKEVTVEQMTGRGLAIDASMNLYQFIIAIRDGQGHSMTNADGEITSHIAGFLSRTLRLLEAGAKPVYVFDGKAPDLKSGELDARREKRAEAEAELKKAEEQGDQEQVKKFMGRVVRVTKKQNDDVRKLLGFMGCPVIDAPCEAEAQCAELCKGGKVFAAATEDLDTLTFGSPKLVRHLFVSEAKKKPVIEVDLNLALEQLGLSMDLFVEFCILCGCDYIDSIKGIGPQSAIRLLLEHKTIEAIIEAGVLKEEQVKGEDWLKRLPRVREAFKCNLGNPVEVPVTKAAEVDVEWKDSDYDGLTKFLVEENQFNPDRVQKQIDRLKASRQKKTQMRMDQFFKVGPQEMKAGDKFDPSRKRKAGAKAKASAKKARK